MSEPLVGRNVNPVSGFDRRVVRKGYTLTLRLLRHSFDLESVAQIGLEEMGCRLLPFLAQEPHPGQLPHLSGWIVPGSVEDRRCQRNHRCGALRDENESLLPQPRMARVPIT